MKQRPTPHVPNYPVAQDISFVRLREVVKMTSLAKSSIYRLMDAGMFPRQMRIGLRRAVGWRRSDLEAWANSRHVSDNASPRKGGQA